MTKKKRGRPFGIPPEQIAAMRQEYVNNPFATGEYLAGKYDLSTTRVREILSNYAYPDDNYVPPKRKGGFRKGLVFIPEHLKEIKDSLVPIPETAHRARGHNRTINKFS